MDRKILLGPSSFAAADKEPLGKLRAAGFGIVDNPYKRKLTKTELKELLTPDVVGLIAGLEILDREVMAGSSLKAISRCGAGVSNVDFAAAKDLGILVASTPDAPTAAVAELTVGAALALLRSLPQMDRDMHAGKWNKMIGGQLSACTVVVVGMGRIGRRVAGLMASFGARIIGVDPFLAPGDAPYPLMTLQDALPQADIVSLHSSGEHPIMAAHEFGILKKGAFLLNAARGGIIDEQALLEALKAKTVGGAWLDTFEPEPYSGPLTEFANVLLTPHVGSYTRECRRRMEMEAADNLLAALGKAQ